MHRKEIAIDAPKCRLKGRTWHFEFYLCWKYTYPKQSKTTYTQNPKMVLAMQSTSLFSLVFFIPSHYPYFIFFSFLFRTVCVCALCVWHCICINAYCSVYEFEWVCWGNPPNFYLQINVLCICYFDTHSSASASSTLQSSTHIYILYRFNVVRMQ